MYLNDKEERNKRASGMLIFLSIFLWTNICGENVHLTFCLIHLRLLFWGGYRLPWKSQVSCPWAPLSSPKDPYVVGSYVSKCPCFIFTFPLKQGCLTSVVYTLTTTPEVSSSLWSKLLSPVYSFSFVLTPSISFSLSLSVSGMHMYTHIHTEINSLHWPGSAFLILK